MSTFEEMLDKAEKRGLKIGQEKGRVVGREEGRVEGRIKGQEGGARDSLLFLLKKKFKRVPKWISTRLSDIRDLAVLRSLIVAAGMSDSLSQFEKSMNYIMRSKRSKL